MLGDAELRHGPQGPCRSASVTAARRGACVVALAVLLGAGCGESPGSETVSASGPAQSPASTEPELTPDENLRINPPPPRNVRVAPAAPGRVSLAWDAPPPVTVPHTYSDAVVEYRVYRRGPGELEFSPIATSTERSYVDTTVAASGRYSYQVSSIRERGVEGSRSDPVDATVTAQSQPTSPAPKGATSGVTRLSRTQVTLRGRVTPRGTTTRYYFRYGKTVRYGAVTRSRTTSSTRTITVAIRVKRLAPATVYHYRLVAKSSAGTSRGRDRTFKTHP